MFENMNLKEANTIAATDIANTADTVDSPTTIPCGITISITLGC
ncbi:hypothetical protein [Corynebacterium pseudodiphtheriticum]|nr:hypothetical protein [Corynebacterium pseudodiphtheriticum]